MRETEIIRAARRGVEEAYLTLFDRYAGIVYLFLLLRVGCENPILPLVDETFCRAFSRIPYRKANLKFGRLLYAIAFQVSVDNIYRRTGTIRATKLAAFLACVRELPENYQMPVLVSHVPRLKQQAIAFSGVLPRDFTMLEERGQAILARQFPDRLEEITKQLECPKRAEDFIQRLRELSIATAWEVFSVFFLRISGWFCFGIVIVGLFLFIRLPTETFESFFPLLVGLIVPPAILAPATKFAAAIDRRLAQKKWKNAKKG